MYVCCINSVGRFEAICTNKDRQQIFLLEEHTFTKMYIAVFVIVYEFQ